MPGIKKTMEEYKKGTLKRPGGKKVTNRKEAIAIGLDSEKDMKKKKKGKK